MEPHPPDPTGDADADAEFRVVDLPVFHLDTAAERVWAAMLRREARDLPGLRALMERPSPFIDE